VAGRSRRRHHCRRLGGVRELPLMNADALFAGVAVSDFNAAQA
jgi:hypothetical protein